MANISVTYSFSNGSTADATEVNTNFQDIIDGTSDGTKDFSISALTCAGTATLNGAVNLGNATTDDITITGRIASDIDPKTAASNTLGDSTQTWQALYLDNGATDGGAVYFNASSTAFLKSDASGADLDMGGFTGFDLGASCVIKTFGLSDASVAASGGDITWSSDAYTITDTDGYSVLHCTTVSTNRTINLPTVADNNGRTITIIKSDSGTGTLTVDGEGSETIGGSATTCVLREQYELITVTSVGGEWQVTGRHIPGAWIPFTTNITNMTTNIQDAGGHYRRVGRSMEVMFGLEYSGANTESTLEVSSLPNSLSVDTSFLDEPNFTTGSDELVCGTWSMRNGLGGFFVGGVGCQQASGNLLFLIDNGTTINNSTNTPLTIADGDVFTCRFTLPCAEFVL